MTLLLLVQHIISVLDEPSFTQLPFSFAHCSPQKHRIFDISTAIIVADVACCCSITRLPLCFVVVVFDLALVASVVAIVAVGYFPLILIFRSYRIE